MKVGIITCHDVYNYGSSLQAYALSQHLQDLGAEVQVIDYKPEYIYRLINFMEVDSPKWQTALWRKWAYRMRLLPLRLARLPKYVRYKKFNRKYLNLTRKRFHAEQELCRLSGFDAFICGSDQIWGSVENKCGEDGAFYLSFVKEGKRIAYAASFGAPEISEKGEACVKTYLPSFHAISVRESSGVELLNRYGIDATQVADPVFLLEKDLWERMSRKPKGLPERYVLVYGYDSCTNLEAVSSELTDLPVVSLKDQRYGGYGPEEFLYMIQNAELVVTSSFHAIAFSLIFEVPFVSVRTGNAPLFERLRSVLELTGLEDRIWKPGKQVSLSVDFSQSGAALIRARERSRAFLKEALYGSEDI